MVVQALCHRLRLAGAVVLLGASLPVAGADPAVREAFRAALAAAERGEPAPHTAALEGYVLAPYLGAAEARFLIARDRPEADTVWPAFRARHPQHVENRDLDREWWRSLGRRQQWARLAAEVPEDPGAPDLACLRLRAGIELGWPEERLVPGIQAVFLTGRSLPEACTRPFEWLRDAGHRPPELVARRLRLALDANEFGLARYLLRLLPEAQRPPYERALALRVEPARGIPALLADPGAAFEPDDLFAGWRRWIAADLEAAARHASRLAQHPRLDATARARVWAELGLRRSWRRDPAALADFRRAGIAPDELTHQWRIRAALWNGDWAQAAAWLDALPEALSAEPRWRYWRARVLELRGESAQAQAGYRALLDANNVYALLAGWRLGQPVAPVARAAEPPLADWQAALAKDPAIQRMQELEALDLRPRFQLEWFAFLAGRDETFANQLSHFAFAQGWWLHGVAAATRARVFDDFARLYPRPFEAAVRRAAADTGLDPEWIYAVIRQESLYDTRATSRANAFGLMQLLLPTAEGVARRHGLPRPTREALYDPARNIPLGSRYLAERLERFGGQWLPALASYNAGAGAVARWLPEQPVAPDIWMENVPFNETREYLGRLLWHRTVYAWLATGEPQRVDDFLGSGVRAVVE